MSEESDQKLEEKQKIAVKILLVGGRGVGKTSLIKSFTHNHASCDRNSTTNYKSVTKIVPLPDKAQVAIELFELSEEKDDGEALKHLVKSCDAALFVYAVNNHNSFDAVSKWLKKVVKLDIYPSLESDEGSLKKLRYALIGNKMDLSHEIVVDNADHSNLASNYKMSSHFVSAKTGLKVNECFIQIIASVLKLKMRVRDWVRYQTLLKPMKRKEIDDESRENKSKEQDSDEISKQMLQLTEGKCRIL